MGILIAAVTFSDIAMSIYGIIKANKSSNSAEKRNKQLNLCSAIILLSLTQQALLSFTNPSKDLSLFVGVGGIIFSSITLVIGFLIAITEKDNLRIREPKKR